MGSELATHDGEKLFIDGCDCGKSDVARDKNNDERWSQCDHLLLG
jgi:hypothetical protein